ncbi:exosortase-associated protein EpsI, V-type [Sphingomonas sp. MMS24-J13]|uniref:exosortase-associated protein EpsI, V-type n=1 Tax=Sphingomonas sp. MMS24-J13 TaxID=3238686 RepID=UPI00384BE46A
MSVGQGPSRRDMLFGGLAVATAATTYAGTPRTKLRMIGDGELDKIVPHQIGGWNEEAIGGLVLPPPDQLAQLLYNQQVARTYTADDALPIMLLMAYGSSQGGMLQIHRPEICYPASGFRLSGTREVSWEWAPGHHVPVRRFSAQSDTRVEHVMYWTRIGNDLPVSWAEQRIAVMRANLTGYIPDGLLVRLSAISEDPAQAEQSLERFASTMLASIGAKGRQQLLGPNV